MRPLKPKDVIYILKQLGFKERRQTGSHLILRNDRTGKIVPLPIHGNRDLKLGTLRSIIRQSGVGLEEFFDLLEN